jgi:hypothetical protein
MTMSTVAVARPASPADETAIGETVADYYLGWYDADPARMARALHPSLAKRGWHPAAGGAPDVDEDTFATMVEDTRRGLGRRSDEDERRFELRGLTVYGDIASVNVFAVPYVDLLQLVRTSEGWRIVNALWCRA